MGEAAAAVVFEQVDAHVDVGNYQVRAFTAGQIGGGKGVGETVMYQVFREAQQLSHDRSLRGAGEAVVADSEVGVHRLEVVFSHHCGPNSVCAAAKSQWRTVIVVPSSWGKPMPP